MKPWEHHSAADQFPDPDGDAAENASKDVYDRGVRKAMEAVIIACDSGATVTMIRTAAQAMIDRLEEKKNE